MSRGTFTERPLGASSAASPAPASTRVAVIVPVYNGASLIEGCLRALDAQTLAAEDYEVVVVDDGSRDGTPSLVQAFAASSRARVRLIERGANAGPAAARNAGLTASSSPIVAFTDADCEVSPDWLARALERLDADASLDAVEGRTLPLGEPGTFTHQMNNTTGGLYMTCNMIYRRSALRSGFDERFRLAFLEDSDVAFTVLEGGGRIEFAPEVLVHHLVLHEGAVKFRREARKRFYNALLARKHPALYRRALRPVVPAFPSPYVDYLLALAALGTALATRAWLVAIPVAFLVLWSFRRVAHVLRARTPGALIRAAFMPLLQSAYALAGMIRFRTLDPRI